jgi:hypothetical protein
MGPPVWQHRLLNYDKVHRARLKCRPPFIIPATTGARPCSSETTLAVGSRDCLEASLGRRAHGAEHPLKWNAYL